MAVRSPPCVECGEQDVDGVTDALGRFWCDDCTIGILTDRTQPLAERQTGSEQLGPVEITVSLPYETYHHLYLRSRRQASTVASLVRYLLRRRLDDEA